MLWHCFSRSFVLSGTDTNQPNTPKTPGSISSNNSKSSRKSGSLYASTPQSDAMRFEPLSTPLGGGAAKGFTPKPTSRGSGDADHFDASSRNQDPLKNMPEAVRARLVPAIFDPIANQCYSLGRPYSRKRLTDLSDKKFNTAFDKYAYGPLDDAFTQTHAVTIRDAWERRHHRTLRRQREQIYADLKQKEVKLYQEGMEAGLAETAAIAVFGNRQSLRRYNSQRLAQYFEVPPPTHPPTPSTHPPIHPHKCWRWWQRWGRW